MKYSERTLKTTFAMDYHESDIASIYDEARAMTPGGIGALAGLALNAPRLKHNLASH